MDWLSRFAAHVVLAGLFVLPVSEVRGQAPAQAFVTYSCSYKSCAEVAKLLRPLLPTTDANSTLQLVVDRDQNRLLVSGPDYVHEITQKLLAEVDRPAPRRPVTAAPQMHGYTLPGRLHAAFQAELTRQMGAAIKTVSDPGSGKVFVTADPQSHALAAEVAASFTGQIQTPLPAPGKVHFHSPDTGDGGTRRRGTAATAAPMVGPKAARTSRFIRVPAGQLDRLQQQIMTIFGTRLAVRSVDARQIFLLTTHGKFPIQLELEFDRVRNGVLVGGAGVAADQLVTLLQSLSQVDRSGRKAKVFGLRRDNHSRLREVIDSGSVQSNRAGLVPVVSAPNGPTIRRLGDSGNSSAANGLQLAGYLFQDESGTPSADSGATVEQPPVTDVGPVRQFEGVDVESLPDLDVIILRGPDQDLDQLAEIIRQLERISQDTQPEIRVLPLQYGQSSAIAEVVEDVKGDLVGGRQGRVSVLPLVKPNSLLIIGWGDAVVATEELIRQLDKPVSPETQSRVFRLKYASAQQVQQTLQSFFSNRGGLGPRVQLATDAGTNSLIAYAAPRDLEEIQKLVEDIDRPEGEAVNRARVFQIENALASDVGQTLQQAIDAAAGNGDRSASLELQVFDAEGQKLLRSGVLRNVQVTPNVRNNTLIVSSPIENLELIEALIQQLDSPAGQAKIKVFRIVNGDATSLIQTLRSLIPSQTAGGTGTSQLSATGEAGLAPLRFSVDVRSNSIIATGSEGDLRIVEALLAKLDQTTSMQRKTAVYRLKNSPAIDVANAVNQYLFNRRQLDSAAPGQANPFAEIEREVVVVPEPIANKLILAATPRYFEEIRELIEKLDESPPQVMIQVLIAEVALNDADEFGVELGLQDSVLFDRSLLGDLLTTSVTQQTSTAAGIVTTTQDVIQAATNIPGFGFNSPQPLGNSGSSTALNNAGTVGGQGISNFAVGRTNEQLGFGGMVLSASSKNVSILLRALRENRRVDVLSRPQIRTLDNQPAYIQVGQRVPRIVGSTVNQNGQSNSVSLENVGLILGVTPRVSPDGTVVMEIDAEKSSLGPEQEGIPVAVSVDGTVIRSPRVDTTTAQATVSAADGETIVLGGLITENGQYVHRSVPFLGEIPIIEHFFRYDSQIKRRTELLIILTPHVIRTPEDNEQLRQLEMARMSWCACDVYRLMDDVGYVPETTFEHVEVGEPEVIYPDRNPTGEIERMLPPEPLQTGTSLERVGTFESGEAFATPGVNAAAGLPVVSPANHTPVGGGR